MCSKYTAGTNMQLCYHTLYHLWVLFHIQVSYESKLYFSFCVGVVAEPGEMAGNGEQTQHATEENAHYLLLLSLFFIFFIFYFFMRWHIMNHSKCTGAL